METVLRLEKNKLGRDFAVGDLHGCFSLFEHALKEASFNPAQDRVICVGDLVNRGPESARALEFLEQDWFYTVCGNNDRAMQQDLQLMNERGVDAVRDEFERNGRGWMLLLDGARQKEFMDAFEALPYAIEVPTKTGELIGFAHAEIPEGLSWQDFVQKLEEGDEKALQTALWGRSRIVQAYKNGYDTDPGVPGIDKVFTGHSLAVGRRASRMGNWFCIDTGAVMRDIGTEGMFPESAPEDLHLTLVDIQATPDEINRMKPYDDNRPYQVIHSQRRQMLRAAQRQMG